LKQVTGATVAFSLRTYSFQSSGLLLKAAVNNKQTTLSQTAKKIATKFFHDQACKEMQQKQHAIIQPTTKSQKKLYISDQK